MSEERTLTAPAEARTIEGTPPSVGDLLYVVSLDENYRAEVIVRGTNSIGEAICERTDAKPLRWRFQDRRVLDFPPEALSRRIPPRTLPEIARELVSEYNGGAALSQIWELMGELKEACARDDRLGHTLLLGELEAPF